MLVRVLRRKKRKEVPITGSIKVWIVQHDVIEWIYII